MKTLIMKQIIFVSPCGPLITHDGRVLRIEDLNPEVKIKWVLGKTEMLKIGLGIIWAGIKMKKRDF